MEDQQHHVSETTSPAWLVERIAGELDAGNRIPIYEQLIAILTRLIAGRALREGSVLPPEPELAAGLGLSRQTVNQALTALARRGLLIRRRGIGTFVASPVIQQRLDGLYSFIRTLNEQGMEPGTRLLGSRVTTDDSASAFLTTSPDGLIYEITRLRSMDGEPVVFEGIFLPIPIGEALPRERLLNEVLYDLIRAVSGVEVTHAEESIQPVAVRRTEAALLGVAIGEPAFLVERATFAGEQPIEFRRSVIRGDRFRFRAHLTGGNLRQDNAPAAVGDASS
jgi:GntR family transcriptional regulator